MTKPVLLQLIRLLKWAQVLGWRSVWGRMIATIQRRGDLRKLRYPGGLRPALGRNNQSDLIMFEQVFVDEDYSIPLPFEPRTIVDAGANVGYASLYFAREFPGAEIIAIEPDPDNFEVLKRNVAGMDRITPLQAGLWGAGGHLQIADADAPKCMVSLKPSSGPGEMIPAVTVGELLTRFDSQSIDLLKMDIEGAERQVFSSSVEQWLPKVKAIMIELHDWQTGGCAEAFYLSLQGRSFQQRSKGDVLLITFSHTAVDKSQRNITG